MYRPMVVLSHAVNYAISEYSPKSYIALNILIHGLNSALVFLVLGQLLPLAGAALGALFFGLHPLQTEVVNYISARSESLAALFYLLAAVCHMAAGRRSPLPNKIPTGPWAIVSWVAYGLALLAKPIALTLPLTLVLLHYCFERFSLRQALYSSAPYIVVSVVYLIVRQSIADILPVAVRGWEVQIATQSKALSHYVHIIFFPVTQNVNQQFFESPTLLSWVPLVSLGAVFSALFVAVLPRFPRLNAPDYRHWAFGTSWFCLCLLPTLLIPLHVLVNDHRPYLAVVGVAFLVGRLSSRREIACVWAGICLVLALLSYQRGQVWQNDITLWSDSVARAPSMSVSHYNLGFALHREGELEAAKRAYERAVELEPRYVRAQTNLGAIYRELGDLKRARTVLEDAIVADPFAVEALNNLALTESSLGQLPEAIALFRRAIKADPTRAELWLNLGLALRDNGQLDEAGHSLHRALELDAQIKHRLGLP